MSRSVYNVYRAHIARVEKPMSVVRVPRVTSVRQAVLLPPNIPVRLAHTRAAQTCLIEPNVLSAHPVVIALRDQFLLHPVPLDRTPLRIEQNHPALVHSRLASPALQDLIALKGHLLLYRVAQDLTHLHYRHPALYVLGDITAGV